MAQSTQLPWTEHLLRIRDLDKDGSRHEFLRRVRHGEFVRVTRGVYVRTSVWTQLDRHARHRAQVKAAALVADDDLVFSHESAAALWRLPSVGAWPERVHVVSPKADGGRSNSHLIRHSVGIPRDLATIDGLSVTTLARTAVDLAATSPFGHAVTVMDAALRRTEHPRFDVPATSLTRDDLYQELDVIPLRRGRLKARKVIEFADGAADRPGESMSRVSMLLAGIPMPLLQAPIAGASGRVYTVDFWWPQFNVVGEFDGRFKYTDPEYMRGRTGEQVLLDEKAREDDIRAADHGMSRWPWEVAISPERLRDHLRRAGVR